MKLIIQNIGTLDKRKGAFRKMKKYRKFIILAVTVLAVGLFGGSIFIYSKAKTTDIFIGSGGKEYQISMGDDFEVHEKDSMDNNVSLGDTIEVNGEKEIVIAISEDGRFLTMPFAEYQP